MGTLENIASSFIQRKKLQLDSNEFIDALKRARIDLVELGLKEASDEAIVSELIRRHPELEPVRDVLIEKGVINDE